MSHKISCRLRFRCAGVREESRLILHFGRKVDTEGEEIVRRGQQMHRVRRACLVGTAALCLALISVPALASAPCSGTLASADTAAGDPSGQPLQQSGGLAIDTRTADAASGVSSSADAEDRPAGTEANSHSDANTSASPDETDQDPGLAAHLGAWIAINDQGAVDSATHAAKENPAPAGPAEHGGSAGSDSSQPFGLPRAGQVSIAAVLALASTGGAVVSLVIARKRHAVAIGRKTPTKRAARK